MAALPERSYLRSRGFSVISGSVPSRMSFSASIGDGALEYAGGSPWAPFAQPANMLRPGFLRMLAEVACFNRRSSSRATGRRLPLRDGTILRCLLRGPSSQAR
jgi:predicted NAD/FAD-binding protein